MRKEPRECIRKRGASRGLLGGKACARPGLLRVRGLWRVVAPAAVLAAVLGGPGAALAQVVATAEATAPHAVYIAGNPDCYPLEYYDREAGVYRGLLPELYARISEQLGVDFAYVRAGEDNLQDRLAANNQVEIVSAHDKGSVAQAYNEVDVVVLSEEGDQRTVCVGFSAIAPDELVATVSEALGDGHSREMLSILAGQVQRRDDRAPVAVLAGVSAVLAVVAVFLGVRLRRANRAALAAR